MGYIRHHAIIVTASGYPLADECLDAAYAQAVARNMAVSEIVRSGTNGYKSFAVFPDGSKEGWDESDAGDAARAGLIAFLTLQRYGDGSSPLSWVEVQYGDDNQVTGIVTHSDEPSRDLPGTLDVGA